MRRQIRRGFATLAAAAMVATLGYAGTAATAAVSGAQLWIGRYNGPANGSDIAKSVAFSPGKVFVAGVSYRGSTTGDDFTLVAHNSVTGARLWTASYDAPAAGSSTLTVAVSPDGTRVFMTGINATRAYNASTGALLWSAPFGGANGALAVAGDGTTVFVTGSASREETGLDYATAAYNAATGAQRWISYYNGTQNGDDSARAISAGGSRVFVTGASPGTSAESDFTTVAYNSATGHQLWVKRYHTAGAPWYDASSAVAVSPDHARVFVTGTGFRADFNSDYATVAYNAATGAQLWVKRYNGPGNAKDYAHAVVVAPNGSKVFVTGESAGGTSTGQDYATVAYSTSNGAQLWVKRYHGTGSGFDSASALVTPGNGRVYVTGVSFGGSVTGRDYATVGYRMDNGTQLWVKRYNGPGSRTDTANAIAANAGGTKVFVTGGSRGSTSQDYATIAYAG